MLLRYNVSNFKSIGHPIEFSMFPPEGCQDERFLKTVPTRAGEWKVLRRGGFFGPNASGKSSFIQSIDFARNFIVEGQKSGKGTGIDPFKGNFEDLNGISLFQFMFYLDGEVYDYGFTLDRRQVHEEWLMQLEEQDFGALFTRVTDEAGKTEIQIESKFAPDNSKDRNLAEVLKDSIQENQKNQLFLYKLYDNGIKKAEKIVGWFKNLQVIFPTTKAFALPIQLKNDEDLRQYIGKMLEQMDTGVHEISVASNEIDFHDLAQKLDIPDKLVEHIEESQNGIFNLDGKYFIYSEQGKRTVVVQLQFNHRLNDHSVSLNIDEESDGTQRLVDLLPMLFTIGKSQSIYFVDEIDRSLHTKLSQYLLDEFAKLSEESENQIVFTAHDVNLINLEHLRQDEIWFLEKNSFGESELKPLSDYAVKEGQDTINAYLNGRFGAIPVIRRHA